MRRSPATGSALPEYDGQAAWWVKPPHEGPGFEAYIIQIIQPGLNEAPLDCPI